MALTNVEFPAYKAALRGWIDEAIAKLQGLPNGIVVSSAVRRWGCDEDGVFRARERPVNAWNSGYRDQLQELPGWQSVVDAAQGDERISRQLDTLVGTVQSATRVEAIHTGLVVLPSPDELSRVDDAFDERYVKLEGYLKADELESATVWPVPGLTGEPLPVSLEPDIELGMMSNAELSLALEFAIVRPNFPTQAIFFARPEDRSCIRYRYRLPKIVGMPDAVDTEASQALEETADRISSDFEEALATVLPRPTLTVGRFTYSSSWRPHGYGVTFRSESRNSYFTRHELDQGQVGEFLDVWRVLRQPDFQRKNRGLALALRRLSYQAQRERPEDELLDIMIAAEALYLSEAGNESDRGELKYRLALRAAFWADAAETDIGRRDIFKLMRTAYDVRSAVAHGGTPKPKDIKVRGEQVALKELVNEARHVVAAGCRKAVAAVASSGGSWPPAWEDLILPGQGSSAER
ncbi:HEPN domain-containing protein [Amycolatopsis sp. CA-126428]|uniref:HEPN domain-containing protein n=1 Tax=Amycolatopsis sp. CA-126428 TaxID=2073158 RepID=UPI0011B0155D|nr:HEPN domain-containing protein [Amycolatopsis sp. CA-126428]